jgi:hypothetical protein
VQNVYSEQQNASEAPPKGCLQGTNRLILFNCRWVGAENRREASGRPEPWVCHQLFVSNACFPPFLALRFSLMALPRLCCCFFSRFGLHKIAQSFRLDHIANLPLTDFSSVPGVRNLHTDFCMNLSSINLSVVSIYEAFLFLRVASYESITTLFLGSVNRNCILFDCFLLLLLHTHYMFRPLRAIFRWNIYTGYYTRSYFFFTTDPLFLFWLSIIHLSELLWWFGLPHSLTNNSGRVLRLFHELWKYLNSFFLVTRQRLRNNHTNIGTHCRP